MRIEIYANKFEVMGPGSIRDHVDVRFTHFDTQRLVKPLRAQIHVVGTAPWQGDKPQYGQSTYDPPAGLKARITDNRAGHVCQAKEIVLKDLAQGLRADPQQR
jgi:hypothetical protein